MRLPKRGSFAPAVRRVILPSAFALFGSAAIVFGAGQATLTFVSGSMVKGLGDGTTTQQNGTGTVTVLPGGLTGINAATALTGLVPSANLTPATGTAPGAVATGTPAVNSFLASFSGGVAQYVQVSFAGLTGMLASAQIPAPTLGSFTCDGSTTSYTLSSAPQSATKLILEIGGVYQNSGSFSTSGATLLLAAACPSGTPIEARNNP